MNAEIKHIEMQTENECVVAWLFGDGWQEKYQQVFQGVEDAEYQLSESFPGVKIIDCTGDE